MTQLPTIRFKQLTQLLVNRKLWFSLSLAMAGFLVINSIIYLAYRQKTYTNTTVAGNHIGMVSFDDLDKQLPKLQLLPTSVSFENGTNTTKLATKVLGIRPDYREIRQQASQNRSWLPIANFWSAHDLAIPLSDTPDTTKSAIGSALSNFQKAAADAKISRQNDSFRLESDITGRTIDMTETRSRLIRALSKGQAVVRVATKPVGAQIKATDLQAELSKLNTQTKTAISLTYADKNQRFSSSEIASWYSQDKAGMVLSDNAIHNSVIKTGSVWGIVVKNTADVVTAIKSAIQTQKGLEVSLIASPKASKTYTYCVATRGVSDSYLPELSSKLQATLNDNRGWAIGGLVQFQPVTASCNLTVWLAAADQMSSFGAICDADWSCTVSPYVIINFDRWTNASTAWNSQGGSLQDYRSMVINHETGHWFGFNHSFCGGAGQQAPVMQQQSIDLQGCAFNPWPLASEQARLKNQLGL